MCECDGKPKLKPMEETTFEGTMGSPVGFEVLPKGSPISEDDMMEGIYQRMGLGEEEEMYR